MDIPFRELLVWQAFLLVYLGLLSVSLYLPIPRVVFRPVCREVFWIVFSLMLVGFYVTLLRVFGPPRLVSILEVYEVRLDAREILKEARWGVGYMLRLVSNTLAPFIFSVGLARRRLLLVGLGFLLSVSAFSFDGAKLTLAFPIFMLAYWILKGFRTEHIVAIVALAVLLCGAIDMIIFQRPFATGLFTYRCLADPGLLSGYYYSFFSQNPKFMWSSGRLGFVLGLTNPYGDYLSPGFLIGLVNFGNPVHNANANIWADGFANFGFIGAFVETVLLLGYLWLYDWVTLRRDPAMGRLLALVPAFVVANDGILTSFVTHGLLSLLLIQMLQPEPSRRVPRPLRTERLGRGIKHGFKKSSTPNLGASTIRYSNLSQRM
jgi:hypothetical protein